MNKFLLSKIYKIPPFVYVLLTLFLLGITTFILLTMGRVTWCTCGYIKLWHGVIQSSENSQHIADFYTFSHVIHGFVFFYFLRRFAKKLPLGMHVLIALIVEIGWEILENSPMVIDCYRTTTISLEYYGDSVINAISDIVAMLFGFWLATRLSVKTVIVLIVLMELIVGFLIRDNLTLNLIMLIYPLEIIKRWQMGG